MCHADNDLSNLCGRLQQPSGAFSRFSPAIDLRLSYKGEDVVQTLGRICRTAGYPATIRVDNGSEFISRDLDL